MTAKDEARLSMYRTVIQFCNNNLTIINANAAFVAVLALITSKVSTLLTNETAARKQTKGVAQDKGTQRATLCLNAFDIAATVFAYASEVNNLTLQQLVKFTLTDLEKTKDELLVPTCNNIKKAATDNLAALATYGITAPTLTAFQNNIDLYSGAVPKPRLAKTAKTTSNKNVKATFQEIDTLFKTRMDKLAGSFRTTAPNFLTEYKEARKIIDPGTGGGSEKPKTDIPK
jgi:hypothetical protein